MRTTFDPEQIVVDAVNDYGSTRDSVALVYAMALRTNAHIDWKRVNGAILLRWSPSGLEYIKRHAWKRATRATSNQEGRPE